MKEAQQRTVARCVVALFLLALVAGSCSETTHRKPEIAVNALLKRQSEALPDGWTFTPAQPKEISTDTDMTDAIWYVGKRITPADAKLRARNIGINEEFHVYWSGYKPLLFPSGRPIGAIGIRQKQPLEDWSYHPPHADDFMYGCIEIEIRELAWQSCDFLMRYEEYVILLEVPIGDFFTRFDLERLLEATDTWMVDFLENSTLQPGSRTVPTVLN